MKCTNTQFRNKLYKKSRSTRSYKLANVSKIHKEVDKMSSRSRQVVPANGTGTSIHPNDGVIERTTSGFAPNQSSLSLIGQTNSLEPTIYVVTINCGLVKGFGHAHPRTLQNLHRIMLHPSENAHKPTNAKQNPISQTIGIQKKKIIIIIIDRETKKECVFKLPGFWVELSELDLVRSDCTSFAVIDDESGTGRSLVKRTNINRRCFRHSSSSSASSSLSSYWSSSFFFRRLSYNCIAFGYLLEKTE